jgi:hypothetical protein
VEKPCQNFGVFDRDPATDHGFGINPSAPKEEEFVRDRTSYFSTVDFATLMPSFPNSPTIHGAPYSGFACHIVRIRSLTSGKDFNGIEFSGITSRHRAFVLREYVFLKFIDFRYFIWIP